MFDNDSVYNGHHHILGVQGESCNESCKGLAHAVITRIPCTNQISWNEELAPRGLVWEDPFLK
jgi:hypothetical protein